MKVTCEKIQDEITYTTTCKIVEFCCKKMKQVFDKKHDRHHSDGSGDFCNAWELDERGIRIPTRTSGYNEYVQSHKCISYCPFCGEAIE